MELNHMTRKLKKGSFMALYTLVVIAAVIVLNLIVGCLLYTSDAADEL